MNQAPLFVDSFRLSGWLLERLGSHKNALAQRLCATAIQLVEEITLALKDRDRLERTQHADELLILLRLQLRLAESIELLTEQQLLHALQEADQIGRQLGGWRRSLTSV